MRIVNAMNQSELRPAGPMDESLGAPSIEVPDLEFTGERIVPGKTAEALFREHEERYVFAGQYVVGKDVLDVACGTGIGTSYLRQAGARKVSGLDLDPGAIAFAKVNYPECEFAQSDATALSLPDGSVDVVVSFETIEHIKDQKKFLQECRRVLRTEGSLICSTPNLGISRWGPENPHHFREFDPSEFKELLESVFPSVQLFGQGNRSYLPFVARRVILRGLERVQLRDRVQKFMFCSSAAVSQRQKFIGDTSRMRQIISRYQDRFLSRPTFLIAVASAPSDRPNLVAKS